LFEILASSSFSPSAQISCEDGGISAFFLTKLKKKAWQRKNFFKVGQ